MLQPSQTAAVGAAEDWCRPGEEPGGACDEACDQAVVWLDDELARDPARVGGKAAALGRLVDEASVPWGFCVTAQALAACRGGRLGPELRDALAAAHRRLGGGAVAVRSSAVAEDGAARSFAGQYRTLLGVRGEAAVAAAVESCLAAAGAPRLARYDSGRSPLCVLVQRMIAADAAAIVFTVDPVTDDRDVVLVEASWGLGDLLVGGEVDPDRWRLRKPDLNVLARRVGEKALTSVLAAGGRRTAAVPNVLRRRPCLDEGQVVAAAELALRLEARTGHPVDVECCFEAGRLHLLQCRPVTALGCRAATGPRGLA